VVLLIKPDCFLVFRAQEQFWSVTYNVLVGTTLLEGVLLKGIDPHIPYVVMCEEALKRDGALDEVLLDEGEEALKRDGALDEVLLDEGEEALKRDGALDGGRCSIIFSILCICIYMYFINNFYT
jgi:hypothetical protein